MKRLFLILLFIVLAIFIYLLFQKNREVLNKSIPAITTIPRPNNSSTNPLTIVSMRQKSYPGSVISFEETLAPSANYNRYLVSYMSEGLKQYGLLTIPQGKKPKDGWPVILFNHGYITPSEYSTEYSYASFVNLLAVAGYVVFKPDYRGNGNSQGIPVQPYISPDYLTDSMNALASVKQYKDANPQKIGVFGHSMGGNISLYEIVISKDIKAAEIMAGVVGDETDILSWWDSRIKAKSIIGNDLDTYYLLQRMISDYGTPVSNPDYWNTIDPTKYISDINAPIQIQVGTADIAVPPNFSSSLRNKLQNANKIVSYYSYVGADHDLSPIITTAFEKTVLFFDKYLK